MKSKTWYLLSLALFLAGVLFWRLGEQRQDNSVVPATAARPSTAVSQPKPAVAPVTAAGKALPAHSVKASAKVNFKDPKHPYRLRNTTNSINTLARSDHAILLRNALIDVSAGQGVEIPDKLKAKGDPGSYIVQSVGPLNDGFRAALKAVDASIVSYIPNNAYLVRMDAAGAQTLAAQPRTLSVTPYEPYFKLEPELIATALDGAPLKGEGLLRVTLFPGEKANAVAALNALQMPIVGEERTPFGPQYVVQANPGKLADLAGLPLVANVENYRRLAALNDLTRPRLGISTNSLAATPIYAPGAYGSLSGTNVFLVVNDQGFVDFRHPDLTNRIIIVTNNIEPQIYTNTNYNIFFPIFDTNGHPTHVGGIIASTGDNGPSGNLPSGSTNGAGFSGMAPAANIISLDFRNWFSISQLLSAGAYTNSSIPGRNHAAIISNNSWGEVNSTSYDSLSAIFDSATRDSLPESPGEQPTLFVVSAGNRGRGTDDGNNGASDSISSPANAKNVIAVGALENLRDITNLVSNPSGCVIITNAFWQPETDSSNQVAAFSSRGNVGIGYEGTYGRFKPDVVAPGTFVVSTRTTFTNWPDYYDGYWSTTTNLTFLAPTNVIFTVLANDVDSYAPFTVPDNATQLVVTIYSPGASLLVYTNTSPNPSAMPSNFAGTNGFTNLVFPTNCPGYDWYVDVVNPNATNVSYRFTNEWMIMTNKGDQFLALSNLNNSFGTSPYYYRYESGTSMSAPAVSGMLALMQEYFEQRQLMTNSPALMKALVINSARRVSNQYSIQVQNAINYEGWGLPNISNSIPPIINTLVGQSNLWPIQMFDQNTNTALSTGQSVTYTVTLDPANASPYPLRVTLVWTDPPGNPAASIKLVNDLDLVVTNTDTSEVYFGNHFAAGSDFTDVNLIAANGTNTLNVVDPSSTNDFINNVENVYLPPNTGTNFTVTVVGHRVNVNALMEVPGDQIKQDFALVIASDNPAVSGALTVSAPVMTVNTNPLVNYFSTTNNSAGNKSTGILKYQHVGANPSFSSVTNGTNLQWVFYVVTNTTDFPIADFRVYSAANLSTLRNLSYGGAVTKPLGPDSGQPLGRNVAADIDLYVGQGLGMSGLTNLDSTVINNIVQNGWASTNRVGSEHVTFTNSVKGNVFYIGVKAEDQQAAEYSFRAQFALTPNVSTDGTNIIIHLSGDIPDGSPDQPGALEDFGDVDQTLADSLTGGQPFSISSITVSNTMTHENFGDLFGLISFEGGGTALNTSTQSVVLNNHDSFINDQFSGTVTVLYDDSPTNPAPNSVMSDGPGSLQDFVGTSPVGTWKLTMIDNSLSFTGRVDDLVIYIKSQQITNTLKAGMSGAGAPNTIAANSTLYFSIIVPPDAVELDIGGQIVSGTGPLYFYVRRDDGTVPRLPTANKYDYTGAMSFGGPDPVIVATTGSSPPLTAGNYLIAVANPNGSAVSFKIYYDFVNNYTFNAANSRLSLTSTPIQEQASIVGILPVAPYSLIFGSPIEVNQPGQVVTSVRVGFRIQHERASDLDIRLQSPNGTTIALAENRGGTSTNGYGMGTNVGEYAYTWFSEDTNRVNQLIKFAANTAFMDYTNPLVIATNYLTNAVALGGAPQPDGSATAVIVRNSRLYMAGNSTAFTSNGFVAQYALPVATNSSPVWSRNWPANTTFGTNYFYGMTATSEGLYVVGDGLDQAVAAGGFHTLVLKSDGTVAAWGAGQVTPVPNIAPEYGQSIIPAGLSGVVGIAAGYYHSAALKSDGSVVAWGDNTSGQLNVPVALLNKVKAIAAGGSNTVALLTNSTVVVWGDNTYNQTNVPAGLTNVVAIAAGDRHIVALKSDGTVVAWGDNSLGQINVTVGLSGVTAIAAGGFHTLALLSGGTVAAWGDNTYGQLDISATAVGVAAVSGGGYHSFALKTNGTLVASGDNSYNQTGPTTASGVTAIACGGYHTVAYKSDGIVVAWGAGTTSTGVFPEYGQSIVPGTLTTSPPALANQHGLVTKFSLTGPTNQMLSGATWAKFEPPTGAFGIFPEYIKGASAMTEGGVEYVYVAGYAQQDPAVSGVNRAFISKLDINGNVIWTANDAALGSGTPLQVSRLNAVVAAKDTNTYGAGVSYDPGPGNKTAYLLIVTNDATAMVQKFSSVANSEYLAVCAYGDAIYAVGDAGGNILIEKWDMNSSSPTPDWSYNASVGTATAVVGYGDRLFVVANNPGRYIDLWTIDQTTGLLKYSTATSYPSTAPTDTYTASGIAMDASDLYVVGTGPNPNPLAAGHVSPLVLRYKVQNDYYAEEDLTLLNGENATGSWQLLVWDNHAGGDASGQLLGWDLQLQLSSPTAPTYQLTEGLTVFGTNLTTLTVNTNVLPPTFTTTFQTNFFYVDVPFTATEADIGFTNYGPGTVFLMFNQTQFPFLGSGDVTLTGAAIPITASGTITIPIAVPATTGYPTLLPGQRFYLAVKNTGVTAITNGFAIGVNFRPNPSYTVYMTADAIASDSIAGGNSPGNLYQFGVAPGLSLYRFSVPSSSGNINVALRRGNVPNAGAFDYTTNIAAGSSGQIIIQTNASMPDISGTWFAVVKNLGATPATYSVLEKPNSPPVVNSGSLALFEDTPTPITLTATDADGDPLTYTILNAPTNGTLSGTLPNLTYTPNALYSGPDSFTFKANDGYVDSGVATISISVLGVNYPPVAQSQSVTVAENSHVSIALVATDVDNDSLTYSVVLNPAHGTLTGTPPNVVYQPALYYSGNDSFGFKANDGQVDSGVATVSITVTHVNYAPVANSQSVSLAENTSTAITLTATDVDGDALTYSVLTNPTHGTLTGAGASFTYRAATNYNGADSFTFKANDGVVDSAPATVSITVTPVNQAPVLTVPGAQSVNENQLLTITGVSVFDVDVGSGKLLASLTATNGALTLATPTGLTILSGTNGVTTNLLIQGTLDVINASFAGLTYRSKTNYHGADLLTIIVNDQGNTGAGGAKSDIKTVALTVVFVNQPPVANAQSIALLQDTSASITLTATDPENDPLTYTVLTNPGHGTLSGTAPNLSYQPAAGYYGTDSFTFKANDGQLDSTPATVSLTITHVNHAPVASAQSVTTAKNTPVAILLVANDVDGGTLTYSVVTQPAHGALSGSGANRTYTPTTNYYGADSFTFKANDGQLDSAPATVSISVTYVNHAPVANAQSVTTAENTPVIITMTGSDVDGDAITFAVVTGPSHGILTGAGASRNYTPNTDYNGADSFTFKANDGQLDSAIATVSITVTAVNQAPGLTVPGPFTMAQDTVLNVSGISVADVDAGSGTLLLNLQVTNGVLTLATTNGLVFHAGNNGATTNLNVEGTLTDLNNALATLTYLPGTNYYGSDLLTLRVNDQGNTGAGGARTDTNTVAITVTPEPAPVASAQSVITAGDAPVNITLVGADAVNRPLTYIIVSGPAHGALSGTGANLTYTPTLYYNGSDSFAFKVNNGQSNSAPAVVSITVTPVNHAPVLAAIGGKSVVEFSLLSFTAVATDPDMPAQTLTFDLPSAPSGATIDPNSGLFQWTPNDQSPKTNLVTIRVTDNGVAPLSDAKTFTIVVQNLTTNLFTLTNGIPVTNLTVRPPGVLTEFYKLTITNTPSKALFELYNLTGNGDLIARLGSFPTATRYDFISANPGTNSEEIVLQTNSTLTSLQGDWYLAVLNLETNRVNYTISASVPVEVGGGLMLISTEGIKFTPAPLVSATNTTPQVTWSTIVGEKYEVEVSTDLINWTSLTNIVVTGPTSTFTDPTPYTSTALRFYRIQQLPQ